MDEKQIPIFDEIFKNLDGILNTEEDVDGLQILASILVLPDEQFETLKPILLDSVDKSFNDPDTQFAFVHMMNVNGLTVEDFDNVDNFVEAISELTVEGVELSDSKKDLLKTIFVSFVNALQNAKGVAHRVIQIPVELCREGAKLPTYATDGSAAMDIYSTEEYTINPGETITIPTGIKVDIPRGYALLIQPRSGMSLRSKIRIPNTPGLIDSDYHDEIKVIIENTDEPIKDVDIVDIYSDEGTELDLSKLYGSAVVIGKGERFAQMRLIEVPVVNWLQVKSIGDFQSDHGKGFGSTGTK